MARTESWSVFLWLVFLFLVARRRWTSQFLVTDRDTKAPEPFPVPTFFAVRMDSLGAVT